MRRRQPRSTLFPYTTLFRSHMFILNPEEVSEGISDVSAVAPGVMGNTGIETYDIVEAIINKIKIDYVVDRKSTRLNSSHVRISYAVFCLKKKKYLLYFLYLQ